ncbi:MAG: ATP-grasp domain-containing protein [Rhodospirillaceae bacterium]|nr:MAG: ATP-grasp domain-containing protein [Rhodospirillaceae bacterium]
MKKRLRVLVLLDADLMPPDSLRGHSPEDIFKWKTEYDVVSELRASGHEVHPLGVQNELKPIRDEIETWKPDIVFNLLEEFHGMTAYDQNVASYLELLRVPYTGCGPRGMVLARGKDLSKKILAYHRVPVPAFAVFPVRRRVVRPKRMTFPLIVKSVNEDASLGIAQASIVHSDEELAARVAFIHDYVGSAIAEQYVAGRELYVGVLGNERRRALPVWELEFTNLAPGANPIATERVKHNPKYQERRGIQEGPAKHLSPELAKRLQDLAKRICRTLDLDGYARVDFRLAEDGVPYFLEANPNPEIAKSEEFAQSAGHAGLKYRDLLNRILLLGIARARRVGLPPD